jgi:hypothetical protein
MQKSLSLPDSLKFLAGPKTTNAVKILNLLAFMVLFAVLIATTVPGADFYASTLPCLLIDSLID